MPDYMRPLTDVAGLASGVVAISAGYYHACALMSTGGIKCWGRNNEGQLGDGTGLGKLVATDVKGLSSGVAAVSVGYLHTCALTTAGGVKCWGSNYRGQIGNNATNNMKVNPTDVPGLSSGVVAISAGSEHTCALTSAGGVKCWGSNQYGELGDNTTEPERRVPTDVFGLSSGVVAISAGGTNTCVLTSEGAVKCWGHNGNGQVGDGTTSACGWNEPCPPIGKIVPTQVSGLTSGIVAVYAAKGWHTCALTSKGEALCWGSNEYGQLGDGTTEDSPVPVKVVGFP